MLSRLTRSACAAAFGATVISAREPRCDCRPPRYQIVRNTWNQNDREGISLSVVISLRDFAPERLQCLIKTLEARYKRPGYVDMDIFSSMQAARTCPPDIPMVEDIAPHCLPRHGEYRFSARTNQRFIFILPMETPSWGGELTAVDLPAATLRPCRLELDRRCVLEIESPHYPEQPPDVRSPQRLWSLARSIVPDGRRSPKSCRHRLRTSGVRPVPADAFARSVLASMRTWRLEESPRDTPFKITVEFSPGELSDAALEFHLPTRIVVRKRF